MIIKMKQAASRADVDYVVARVHSLGLKSHVSEDGGQILIGILGSFDDATPSAFTGLRGVERVLPTRRAYRLASKEYRSDPTVVRVGDVEIGGDEIVVMAGPCSVESRDLLIEAALHAQKAGARILRGGAFKPRTSPYSFQGMAEEGLKILAEARDLTGMPVITEVMSSETVPLVAQYADILQIGTRNMQNFHLLTAVGKAGKPVLLKRGMMSTVEELLLSAEYIMSQGTTQVMLCERGIRTFETSTRNTLDLNAIPVLEELTHLPVVVDPSHATGRRSLVPAMARAGIAAGADGLIIEMHQNPEQAMSDGDQSVTPEQLASLVEECRRVAVAVGRTL